MKKLLALLLLITIGATASAADLPFNFVRDESGKLLKVVIAHNKSLTAVDFLEEFKSSIEQAGKSLPIDQIDMEGFAKLSKKEQKAYLEALDVLKQKSAIAALDDENVRLELDKVIELLTKDRFFKLLADPVNPKAFDQELILVEGVQKALDLAQEVWGIKSPLFSVFEFLVDEYLESLVSQREFYQNALLTYINSTDEFSAEEIAYIKSSIFYSRVGLTKFSTRKKAIKQWDTFGLKSEKEFTEKCKATEVTSFHYCFKFEKTSIMNLVDKKNSLSKKLSQTFDYKKPGYTAQVRWFVFATKLGLKLLPVPGLVKDPVKKWLESFYKKQRRREGLLYSAAVLKGQDDLAAWIIENTANPSIR